MPVEQRSIYSGPIRRSLERLEKMILDLSAALTARADTLEQRITHLETRPPEPPPE